MRSLIIICKSFAASNKIIFIVVLLFAVISISLYRDFTPDDAFIHIGYAKDIYDGKGFSFAGNITYGSTSPIWPLLIASLTPLNIDLEGTAKLLSFIFAGASISLMYFVARLRFNHVISVIGSCLLCFNAYFLRWALTGMEACAASFFMLILIYILFKESRTTASNYLYFLIGLAPLIRPEFYLFIFIFYFYFFFILRSKNYLMKLVLTIIPAIVWNCYANFYYGTIIPSTFSVKAGDSFFSMEWNTIIRSVKLVLSGNLIELCFILATAFLLAWKYRYNLRKVTRLIIRSEFIVIVIWIALFYLYYILKNVTIISRYSLALLPSVILLTFFLLTVVFERYKLSQKIKSNVLSILVVTSLVVNGGFTYFVVKPDADSFVAGFQREYKNIASILKEGHEEGSVALTDVGIIGVYSGMRIYDFVGLVDKDRAYFSNKKDYFMNKRPRYLITHGEINVDELKDANAKFNEIYTANIEGFGINKKGNVKVSVYRVDWN